MITFILGCFIGCLVALWCACLYFQPSSNWMDGYERARKTYSNWDEGFAAAYKSAEQLFRDYDRGFGDGFEAGWDSALTQEKDYMEHKCFSCEHCVPHSSIDGTCTEYDCRFWKGATRRDGSCHEWLNKARA